MHTPTTHIPVPPSRSGPPGKYLFQSLEVGQSVLEIPLPDVTAANFRNRVRSSVKHFAAAYERAYVTRAEGNSIRVWRTK